MTNEEAIEYLNQLIETGYDSTHNGERLKAAIYALENIDRIKAKLAARDKLVDELEYRVFLLTDERDVLIEEFRKACNENCNFCKHFKHKDECKECTVENDLWEWRGI